MKANRKRLKFDLVLRVKKLGPDFVAPKLGKFLFFDTFFGFLPFDFLDLDNF